MHYTHIVQPVNDIGVSVWPLAILILALFGCWWLSKVITSSHHSMNMVNILNEMYAAGIKLLF